MAQNNWTQRVLKPAATQEMLEVAAAARELAQHDASKGRLAIQTVADIALIGTAIISGALGTIELRKAFAGPRHKTHAANMSESAGDGNSQTRNPGQHRITTPAQLHSLQPKAEKHR